MSRQFREALADGLPIILILMGLNGLSIAMGLVLHLYLAPGGSPYGPAITGRSALLAIMEHMTGGFIVGLASSRLKVAIVGAAFQPLIDIDHVVIWLNLPVDARIGHSFFVLIALVLIVSRLHLWPSGPLDFVLFACAQFSIHFAIAPPGFPLLAPFLGYTFRFSSLIAGLIGLALSSAMLLKSLHNNSC